MRRRPSVRLQSFNCTPQNRCIDTKCSAKLPQSTLSHCPQANRLAAIPPPARRTRTRFLPQRPNATTSPPLAHPSSQRIRLHPRRRCSNRHPARRQRPRCPQHSRPKDNPRLGPSTRPNGPRPLHTAYEPLNTRRRHSRSQSTWSRRPQTSRRRQTQHSGEQPRRSGAQASRKDVGRRRDYEHETRGCRTR